MLVQIRQMTKIEDLRSALDWTVFGIGAVSLTVAIAATVLNYTAQTRSDAPRAATVQTTG